MSDNKAVAVQSLTSPATLLQMAVEQNADLDKLEKLMDLQERWESKEAKKAFNDALAVFQSKLTSIAKTKDGHNCKYADMDDITKAIRPILEITGLSYRFEQAQDNQTVTVTCIAKHSGGHEERNTMTAPNDSSGGKNAIQAIASTLTYMRRYTLTGAFGISTGGEDDDGGKPSVGVDELLNYSLFIRAHFLSIAAVKEAIALNDLSTAKEAWSEIPEQDQQVLWRAPTKGGVLETNERAVMKSNEWGQA